MARSYSSVREMLVGLKVSKASLALFDSMQEEHSVSRNLFVTRCILKLRKVKGLSNAEMERIEGAKNSELSMDDVGRYLAGLVQQST